MLLALFLLCHKVKRINRYNTEYKLLVFSWSNTITTFCIFIAQHPSLWIIP